MITKKDVVEMVCFCVLMAVMMIVLGLDLNSVYPAYQ